MMRDLLRFRPIYQERVWGGRLLADSLGHDNGIGRDARELLRKVQAAQYIAANPGQVCPAKWTPGAETLAPSLDLVGKI